MQQKQALVRTGRHTYYTRVQEAGAMGGQKAEQGCLRNALQGGQSIWCFIISKLTVTAKHQTHF